MSKYVILGDTHFGIKGFSQTYFEMQANWFEQVLFPYMKKNKIKNIIQLGDLFDVRKATATRIIDGTKQRIFDKIKENKFHMTVLVGNHDATFKNTNEINTPNAVLAEYRDCIEVISKPTVKNVFCFIPWICEENVEEVYRILNSEHTSEYLFGHFEIDGFEFYRGVPSHGGVSPSLFKNFKHVFSGHYHTRSSRGNITYVGTPYELNWADSEDPKGFGVFDTTKETFEFVKNDEVWDMHVKLRVYDTKEIPSHLNQKYVRLYVQAGTDKKTIDKIESEILKQSPADLKVIEPSNKVNVAQVEESEVQSEDTLTIIRSIALQSDVENKEKVIEVLTELYLEALNADN